MLARIASSSHPSISFQGNSTALFIEAGSPYHQVAPRLLGAI